MQISRSFLFYWFMENDDKKRTMTQNCYLIDSWGCKRDKRRCIKLQNTQTVIIIYIVSDMLWILCVHVESVNRKQLVIGFIFNFFLVSLFFLLQFFLIALSRKIYYSLANFFFGFSFNFPRLQFFSKIFSRILVKNFADREIYFLAIRWSCMKLERQLSQKKKTAQDFKVKNLSRNRQSIKTFEQH